MMGSGGKGGKELVRLLAQYIRIRYRRAWTSRKAFERWQERRILKRLRYVQANSPFYRELWANQLLAQWRQFPIIDKTAMMEHFDHLNTAGIRKEEAMEVALEAERTRNFLPRIGKVTVGLSSGTSGSRGLFLVSEREQAAWAGMMLAKVLPKPLWQAEKIAFFLV
jgi:putative adenylate-forming enzyme